jgi:hypothetical protein
MFHLQIVVVYMMCSHVLQITLIFFCLTIIRNLRRRLAKSLGYNLIHERFMGGVAELAYDESIM